MTHSTSAPAATGAPHNSPTQMTDVRIPIAKPPIASITSPSYWDFGDRKEDPIHRIHAYPAKFPAFITTKALHYAQQHGVDVQLVADVFCGCGTTAVEARRNGKSFWGCDINPVATLIAHVKTRQHHDAGLERTFAAITNAFAARQPSVGDRASVCDRIRHWFTDRNIEDLLRLRQAIHQSAPLRSRYRKFFLCAFSNILKPTSRWLTKSIKPQLDPDKTPREVMEAFADQVDMMRKACAASISDSASENSTSRSHDSAALTPNPPVRIRNRNFLAFRLPDCRPDLIVTSPPYVTSYNYADIHQLSALWLGYASDYRDMRKNMMGNEFGVGPLARATIKRLGPLATETYNALAHRDQRKARSVARYYYDMSKAVAKCRSLLNHGGMAVFVIGNTSYQGVGIDNRAHMVHCMQSAGYHDVEARRRRVSLKTMTPYRDSRGRFTRDGTQRRVYGEEFVVTGRRP